VMLSVLLVLLVHSMTLLPVRALCVRLGLFLKWVVMLVPLVKKEQSGCHLPGVKSAILELIPLMGENARTVMLDM